MTKLRYSMDGKRTLPTESETFTVDKSKVIGEVGKDCEEDFYIRLGSGYLSNFTINVYRNETTGECSCIIRGNGKEEITNLADCLIWIGEKLKNNLN